MAEGSKRGQAVVYGEGGDFHAIGIIASGQL